MVIYESAREEVLDKVRGLPELASRIYSNDSVMELIGYDGNITKIEWVNDLIARSEHPLPTEWQRFFNKLESGFVFISPYGRMLLLSRRHQELKQVAEHGIFKVKMRVSLSDDEHGGKHCDFCLSVAHATEMVRFRLGKNGFYVVTNRITGEEKVGKLIEHLEEMGNWINKLSDLYFKRKDCLHQLFHIINEETVVTLPTETNVLRMCLMFDGENAALIGVDLCGDADVEKLSIWCVDEHKTIELKEEVVEMRANVYKKMVEHYTHLKRVERLIKRLN